MASVDFGDVEIDWLGHASVKLSNGDTTIYIDPWSEVMEETEAEKADVIVSTHDHFDHFDLDAIHELKKENTVLVCTEESEDKVPEDISYKVIRSGEEVEARGITFRGFPAYNVDKFREPGDPFHPEGFCVGVLFDLEGLRFYHASDTDPISELEDLKQENIDIAFLPVGGHYTMNQEEAIDAVKMFDPESVVPVHYGSIEETEADITKFKNDLMEETGSKPLILD